MKYRFLFIFILFFLSSSNRILQAQLLILIEKKILLLPYGFKIESFSPLNRASTLFIPILYPHPVNIFPLKL